MASINENIAKNIILLRKERKWTQQDLAERVNYSDKTISKWERGESTPDIEMLCKVAEVFNVDINFLIAEHSNLEVKNLQNQNYKFVRGLLIVILVCVAIFTISTIIFTFPTLRDPQNAKRFWVAFVFAIPFCSLVCIFYSRRSHYWLMQMICVSVFIWSLIASLFCVGLVMGYYAFWMLFLVGVPIQAAICLFFFWKRTF
ncbi:MAG: helix-turn-helix domain-containing protein [Bacilli bacterium]|nr:helix-turn-helix domain-containing protein [Bacilli bacterium]